MAAAPETDGRPGATPVADAPGAAGPAGAARAAGGPEGGPGALGAARPVPVAVRAFWGGLVLVAAVALAVLECFLVPLRIGTVPVPVCVPLAMVGNVVLARLAGRLAGVPLLGVLPPVLWLAVVLTLAAPRAEGDVIVPGTLTGLVFLFAGSVAGAYGAASTMIRRKNPTIAAGG
ncbi:MAG TPA: hypothetical protein VFR35_10970 [Actinoplanes sp.]|nr:hypothetical protein [Actinoplanes sp.]